MHNDPEAITRLREWVKPGDTLRTIHRYTSRSGMLRVIDLVKLQCEEHGEVRVLSLGWNAAKALGRRYDNDREGVRCQGAGMDMGFDLVYSLSLTLFKDGYALEHQWL